MAITASSRYTEQGLLLFQQTAAQRVSPGHYRRLRMAYMVGGVVLLVAGGWFLLDFCRAQRDVLTLLLAGITLYLSAQLIWMGVRYYRYFARRALRLIPEQAREIFFSFEPDQVVISNRLRSVSFAYDQFGAVCETAECFLFYLSDRNGYILEKSGLAGTDAQTLRAFLNQRLSQPVQVL